MKCTILGSHCQGTSSFRYKGIPDDILDMIFRELYDKEIDLVRTAIESDLAARELENERESVKEE